MPTIEIPNIEQSIQALIPTITDEVAGEIRKQCLAGMSYTISKQVQEVVGEHIRDVILPAVRDELAAHEAEIKASVIAAVKQVFVAAGASLVDHATKKLASYEGDKLLTQMMGPLLRGY